MLTKENLAGFSKHLFWDTQIHEVLKLDDPLPFLVQRVLEYGLITVSNEPIENFACYTTRQLNPSFY